MKTTYIVVSKKGMCPFLTTTNKKKAKTASKLAKRLGLDGNIIESC